MIDLCCWREFDFKSTLPTLTLRGSKGWTNPCYILKATLSCQFKTQETNWELHFYDKISKKIPKLTANLVNSGRNHSLGLGTFNSKVFCRGFTLYSSAPGKGLWMSSSPVSFICRKHHWCHCYILKFANMTAMAWLLIFLCFLLPKAQLAKKEILRTTNKKEVGIKNPQSILSCLSKQFSLGICWVPVCSGWLLNQQRFQRQISSRILKECAIFFSL